MIEAVAASVVAPVGVLVIVAFEAAPAVAPVAFFCAVPRDVPGIMKNSRQSSS